MGNTVLTYLPFSEDVKTAMRKTFVPFAVAQIVLYPVNRNVCLRQTLVLRTMPIHPSLSLRPCRKSDQRSESVGYAAGCRLFEYCPHLRRC